MKIIVVLIEKFDEKMFEESADLEKRNQNK